MVLRRRFQENATPSEDPKSHKASKGDSFTNSPSNAQLRAHESKPMSYRTARHAMLRLMAVVYLAAFSSAYFQNNGLMGTNGLMPAQDYMKDLQNRFPGQGWRGFSRHPTIFWWIPLTDWNMELVAMVGMLGSTLGILGFISWFCQFALWLLYFSIVTIAGGTPFYAYGWESQILETGFLTIFLCPLPCRDHGGRLRFFIIGFPKNGEAEHEPSRVVLWLFRWLIFRISIGAGLIKIRGSSCWTAKTCLHYHFETQPLPSPLSFFYHFLPNRIHKSMVDTDLLVQVYTSFLVLLPAQLPRLRIPSRCCLFLLRLSGFLQAGFMVGILLSGNFSVLNHLTIVPALACLDDSCWPKLIRTQDTLSAKVEPACFYPRRFRHFLDISLLACIGVLSWPIVANLMQLNGGRQVMNASFDPFRLVNTYGAFGSVGEARYEPIISISDDGLAWEELEFPCKPGSLTRRPCFCAPYHYRLDWNIWFLGFKPHQAYLKHRESWMYNLLAKILNDPIDQRKPWLDLFDPSTARTLMKRYYQDGKAPKYAKVDMFHYKMAAPLWTIVRGKIFNSRTEQITWWKRWFEEVLIPPVEFDRRKLRLVFATVSRIDL